MNQYKRLFKKKRFYFVILLLIIFLLIMIFVLKNGVLEIDKISYSFIKDKMMNNKVTFLMKIMTFLGGEVFISLGIILLLFLLKNKKLWLGILGSALLPLEINSFIKIILQRERPLVSNHLVNVIGYSFPSGHSMVSMAFYGYIIYLVYVYVNKKYKWLLISILSLIIIGIGFSRIYLGVHYLSDVLAGFLLALIYLVIYISLYNKVLQGVDKKK